MPTPEHNPQSIPPSEIPPGYRLCRESEREKLPADAKFWGYVHGQPNWLKESCCQGEALQDWEWKEYTYITATPLPESEREVQAASPWIPRSVREPVDKDFPVFLYADKPGLWSAKTQLRLCYRLSCMANFEFKDATHWQPAATKLPAPPPTPAKTQREKDEAAFNRLWIAGEMTSYKESEVRDASKCMFEAALETERAHFGGRSSAEVARVMETIVNKWDINGVFNHLENLQTLRALLSPQKERETKHE